MTASGTNAEVLRSLGHLARGLSALFWGLPAALVVCFHTARAESLKPFNLVPPLVCTGLLVYGLWQLGTFQRQERIWRNTLDLARVLGLINFSLSPFLYWSNRVPGNVYLSTMGLVMAVSALMFLASLNLVLQRLTAMLPDEALRLETRQFTSLNLNLILATFLLGVVYLAIQKWPDPPLQMQLMMAMLVQRGGYWILFSLVPLVLLPVAMTMALLWKIKEVILESVFGTRP
jgi:hypothetical protein